MQTQAGSSGAGSQPAVSAADDDAASGSPVIHLAPISDTAVAAALHRALGDAMAAHPPGPGDCVLVAAQDVERITTACVQILLAADHALARRGARLRVCSASDAMHVGFGELGLAADLDRWTSAHG